MAKKVMLSKRRYFSEEFKKSRVEEYEKGKFTVNELSVLFGITRANIYRWIYKYSVYNKKGYTLVEKKDSGKQKVKELTDRIKELEQMVGQKQIKIEFLEKMIEFAEEDFGIDIKKKQNTERSNTSKHIDSK